MKTLKRLFLLALVLIPTLVLVSCKQPNANPEKAKAALEENGYITTLTDYGKNAQLLTGTKVVSAIPLKTEFIWVFYFDSAADCNDSWEEIKEKYTAEAEKENEDAEIIVKKSGKMIYVGTEQAIKDAK